MAIPVGSLSQELRILRKTPRGMETLATLPVRFVPMTGKPKVDHELTLYKPKTTIRSKPWECVMRFVTTRVGAFVAAVSMAAVSTAVAQQAGQATKPFEPASGQAGKDVVWVPTPQATVDKMLDLAKVTANDYVIDLGSGNGVTVITAAKRGATALGVEFNPEMVALSQKLAKEAGVSDKATFIRADLFETDLSKATVITLFLLPDINVRLRPKLLRPAAGHPRVLEHVHDGGLGARLPGRVIALHVLVHSTVLGSACQG